MKMKTLEKNLYRCVCASIFTILIILQSHADSGNKISNYIGIDILCSNMQFKEDFGSSIMSKKLSPGINLSIGYMFNQYIGTEIGFEFYKKMKRTANNVHGVVAGVNLSQYDVNDWESYKTSISQRHPYIGIVIKHNINDNNMLSVLAGGSLSHIKAQSIMFDNRMQHIQPVGNRIRTFSKTKLIPIIKATVEHKFNDKFSVTAIASWKQTSLFKMKSIEKPSSDTCIKPRDSFGFGVGVKYYVF